MTFFPNGTINEWHKNNLKPKMHWDFLNEMPAEGFSESDRPNLVDGLYKEGKKVKGLKGKAV